MSRQDTIPPRFAERLLSWICKQDLLEEILGDLHEYHEELLELPAWKRRMYYWFHTMNFLRPFAIKRLGGDYKLNQYGMFKNYFKTSLRSLRKSPLTSFINVFGLAVGIGACMIVYAFIAFDLSTDRFHEFKDQVYLTTFSVDREGTEEVYGTSPAPLGAMLREDFTSIEQVCRIQDGNVVMKFEDNVFHERVRFVDTEFLEMFTFPLKWGAASSLADVNSIILSEEMSIKYFGHENPVGREIKMIAGEEREKTFKVSGVAQEFPLARIIDFGFLVNFENLKLTNPDLDVHDWGGLINATFVKVNDANNLPIIAEGMEKYRILQNQVESDWPINDFGFVSLHDLHLASDEIRNDISYDGSDEGRIGLPFIGGFILFLACFNYINIAIVSAAKRLKEIGLRKVIGANKRLVVVQFLSENLMITFLAGILGFILASTVFLPWFAQFSGITSEFDLLDGNMWLFLGVILLFTGIVSGIYPAFYIAKFDVVRIFKGTVKFGQKNRLTKVFLAVQLMLACVGIAFAVMFAQNSWYQERRDWGYNQKETLYLEVPDRSSFEQLEASFAKDPNVLSMSGSMHHLGKGASTTIVHLPERQYEVREVSVDASYSETMGLELVDGRFFEEDHESDYQSIVVNEMFLKNILDNKPDTQVKIDSISYKVVGVLKDFHFYNFYYEQKPTIFTLSNPDDYQYLSIKLRDGAQVDTYKKLQSEWARILPETPFKGGFQEDTWPGFYEDLDTMQRFTRAVAMVFIILTALGVYGLVKLNIIGRLREFSIRKALGANTKHLASNVFNQYVILSIVGVVVGAPLGHIMNTAMIDMMFPEPRPFGYTGAIISAVILVIVLVTVISSQIKQVIKANPVEGLKVE